MSFRNVISHHVTVISTALDASDLSLLPVAGVVPACAALDCLSVFAHSVGDAAVVAKIMRSADAGAEDVWRRDPVALSTPPLTDGSSHGFRFAVPTSEFLEFEGAGKHAAWKQYHIKSFKLGVPCRDTVIVRYQ